MPLPRVRVVAPCQHKSGCDREAGELLVIGEASAWLCPHHKELVETSMLSLEWAMLDLDLPPDEP
jgi:hypothetical protein